MTPNGFRRIALGLTDVIEGAHHGHADFRVGGRVFASLGYPDDKWGMVVLTPEQQKSWVRDYPKEFVPAKGKWGEQGATTVHLRSVSEESVGETLTLARQNAVAKGPTRTRAAKGRRKKA
jgi:hypothetical protein